MGMGWEVLLHGYSSCPRERERDGMNRTLPNLPAISRSNNNNDDDECNTSRKSPQKELPPLFRPFPQQEPQPPFPQQNTCYSFPSWCYALLRRFGGVFSSLVLPSRFDAMLRFGGRPRFRNSIICIDYRRLFFTTRNALLRCRLWSGCRLWFGVPELMLRFGAVFGDSTFPSWCYALIAAEYAWLWDLLKISIVEDEKNDSGNTRIVLLSYAPNTILPLPFPPGNPSEQQRRLYCRSPVFERER